MFRPERGVSINGESVEGGRPPYGSVALTEVSQSSLALSIIQAASK